MQAAEQPATTDGETLIASQQELEAFARHPGSGLNAALRGVLAETALTGRIRYDWQLLQPLCHSLIDSNLAEFAAEELEAGPPRPMPGGISLESLQAGLHGLVDSFAEAPFTLQRLCEVLLEPRKQYRRLDKLAGAIEKLLLVTSTCPVSLGLPPRPSLSSLGPVNNNPPSPYGAASPTAAAAATAGAQQQLLPNGRDAEPGGSGSGDKTSAVFRMFMHAEASGSGAGSGSGSGSGLVVGPQPDGASGIALDGMTPDETAEAKLAAERFVQDALRIDPEPSAAEEQAAGPAAAPPAGSDEQQQQQQGGMPSAALLEQEPQQPGSAAARSEDTSLVAAGGANGQGASAGDEQAAAAAMDIDSGAGLGASLGEGDAAEAVSPTVAGAGKQEAQQAS